GNQRVGTKGDKTLVVTNTGTDTLIISAIAATGDFVNTDATPINLAPNATTTLTVSFTPTALGPANGTLTITSDASTSPTVVDLSGQGVIPGLTPSATVFQFGTIKVGTTSPAQQLVLTNTGLTSSVITAITMPAQFTLVSAPALPISLLPDAGVTLTVT